MQDKELRIGNLVIIDSTLVEMKVKYFGRNKRPVPIDPTRLQRFGFTKREDFDVFTNVWERKGFIVSLGDYTNIHIDGVDEETSIKCYEELYAHELQNLYFALIGEELVWGQSHKKNKKTVMNTETDYKKALHAVNSIPHFFLGQEVETRDGIGIIVKFS